MNRAPLGISAQGAGAVTVAAPNFTLRRAVVEIATDDSTAIFAMIEDSLRQLRETLGEGVSVEIEELIVRIGPPSEEVA